MTAKMCLSDNLINLHHCLIFIQLMYINFLFLASLAEKPLLSPHGCHMRRYVKSLRRLALLGIEAAEDPQAQYWRDVVPM